MDCTFGDDSFYQPMWRMDAAASAKANLELHFQPDDIEITDRVTVLWEIG